MPYWEAVRPTRRAISPLFAMRMDFNGSVSIAWFAEVVLFHLRTVFGRVELVARSARRREAEDIVDDGDDSPI